MLILTGAELLNRHLVYIWWRKREPLYVGQSSAGLSRPVDIRHHRLGVDMQPDDRIEVRFCESAQEAQALEAELIRDLHPARNQVVPSGASKVPAKGTPEHHAELDRLIRQAFPGPPGEPEPPDESWVRA